MGCSASATVHITYMHVCPIIMSTGLMCVNMCNGNVFTTDGWSNYDNLSVYTGIIPFQRNLPRYKGIYPFIHIFMYIYMWYLSVIKEGLKTSTSELGVCLCFWVHNLWACYWSNSLESWDIIGWDWDEGSRECPKNYGVVHSASIQRLGRSSPVQQYNWAIRMPIT